jgi:hypothetical protein
MTDIPGLASLLMDYIENGKSSYGVDLFQLRERFRREGAAADAGPEMLAALKLAQIALDTAPRFGVPYASTESFPRADSYKIAAKVDAAVKLGETQRGR